MFVVLTTDFSRSTHVRGSIHCIGLVQCAYQSVLLTSIKYRKHDYGCCLSRVFSVDNLKMSRFSPMELCGVSTNGDSRLAGE